MSAFGVTTVIDDDLEDVNDLLVRGGFLRQVVKPTRVKPTRMP
jgi:hypothetical protein